MAKLIGNEVFIDIASKEYPLSLAAIRSKNPHKMFGNAATTDLMRAFGYEVVQQVERPVGDLVTEEPPSKLKMVISKCLASVLILRKNPLNAWLVPSACLLTK